MGSIINRGSNNMNYNKLPADPTALILGIVSVVIVIMGCCCGLFAIGSLIMSIIGLVMANKSIKLYKLNPENYTTQSRSNTGVGQVICIVGIVVSSIFLLINVVYFAIVGSSLFGSEATKKILEEYNLNKEKTEVQYEQTDTLKSNDFEETDSIFVDSSEVE